MFVKLYGNVWSFTWLTIIRKDDVISVVHMSKLRLRTFNYFTAGRNINPLGYESRVCQTAEPTFLNSSFKVSIARRIYKWQFHKKRRRKEKKPENQAKTEFITSFSQITSLISG